MKICKKCKDSLKGRRKVINGHAEYLCIDCHQAKVDKSGIVTAPVFKDTIAGRQVKVVARPNRKESKVKVIPTPVVVVNKTDDTAKLFKKNNGKKDKALVGPEAEINAAPTSK